MRCVARRFAALLALPFAAAAPAPDSLGAVAHQASLPSALPGANVARTEEARALAAQTGVVMIDVSEVPRRPAGLAPGAPWLPPSHRDIPGSIWIPGAGREPIRPDVEAYYRARLAGLTAGSSDRALMIYCHPNCRLSWNAARRAIGYGYRRVFWYPDGIEGWQDAGLPTAPANPEGPAAPESREMPEPAPPR